MLRSSSIACLLARLIDKGLFSTVGEGLQTANSRCLLSSCLLAVLSLFLANSSPISSLASETSEMFCHFVLTTKATQLLT